MWQNTLTQIALSLLLHLKFKMSANILQIKMKRDNIENLLFSSGFTLEQRKSLIKLMICSEFCLFRNFHD